MTKLIQGEHIKCKEEGSEDKTGETSTLGPWAEEEQAVQRNWER